MNINRKLAIVLLVGVCLLQIQCKVKVQNSPTEDLSRFFGTFKGTAATAIKGEISERDLTVTIKPWEDKGFTVEWTTVSYRANGEQKKSSPSINFYSSSRPGIYASAMRTNVFGHTVPFDPLSADAHPYVWAGLEDDTLTVSALYIVADGGYEMHVYKRTLQEDGLALEFERTKDGEVITEVSAMLEPVNP